MTLLRFEERFPPVHDAAVYVYLSTLKWKTAAVIYLTQHSTTCFCMSVEFLVFFLSHLKQKQVKSNFYKEFFAMKNWAKFISKFCIG